MLYFDKMKESADITKTILESCKKHILSVETISSLEINSYAEIQMNRFGVTSAFRGVNGFPHVMCISINDCIIHGLPREDIRIVKGDLVSLDFGVVFEGCYSDMAISFINTNRIAQLGDKFKLVKNTKKALDEAVIVLNNNYPDITLSNITATIDKYKDKYGIVKGFGGHAIGKVLHDSSIFVANTWDDFNGEARLEVETYFTIEPLFTLGSNETKLDSDGFTIRTKDGSLACHWEYTLAITQEGVIILGEDKDAK